MGSRKRLLHAGRVVTLARETHRLPDGREADFEIVHHPGGAAVLPVLDDGRLLFIRQFRPAAGGEIVEIPAGRLEGDEPPAACAERELAEEVGFRPGRLEPLGQLLPSVGYCDERIHLFLARDLVPVPAAPEPEEFIVRLPLTPAAALAMLQRGEIPDAKTQLALLLFLHGRHGA